jgi:hypothetical protein
MRQIPRSGPAGPARRQVRTTFELTPTDGRYFGIGTLCRRQATAEAAVIARDVIASGGLDGAAILERCQGGMRLRRLDVARVARRLDAHHVGIGVLCRRQATAEAAAIEWVPLRSWPSKQKYPFVL